MLEVKELLTDLESVGASIILRDGAPILKGKVDAETMSRIRELKQSIIKYLSAPPEAVPTALFTEPKAEKHGSALDIIGKSEVAKNKIKKKLEVEPIKSYKMVVGQCSCCAKPIVGWLAKNDHLSGGYIYAREDMYYCMICEDLLRKIDAASEAKIELAKRIKEPECNAVEVNAVRCETCFDGTIRQQKGLDKDGNAITVMLDCTQCDGKGNRFV